MLGIKSVLAGSVIALLGTVGAHATVIYNWHSTGQGHFVTATGGQLAFTNAAYQRGALDFYANYGAQGTSPGVVIGGGATNLHITNSPLVSASLDLSGIAPQIFVRPGSTFFTEDEVPVDATVTFNPDGTLSGNVFLSSLDGQANLAGQGSNWNTSDYLSDYFAGGPCGGPVACSVGSGYWKLASITPVGLPEPPAWPLFALGALGALGLFSVRRRRSVTAVAV